MLESTGSKSMLPLLTASDGMVASGVPSGYILKHAPGNTQDLLSQILLQSLEMKRVHDTIECQRPGSHLADCTEWSMFVLLPLLPLIIDKDSTD